MTLSEEELAEERTGPGPARAAPPSRLRVVTGRFFAPRQGRLGFAVLAVLVALACAGPLFSPWTYTDKDFLAFLRPPSAAHWFGTSQTGADVYAMTLRGMRRSLLVGLLAALVSTALAALVGAFAGYFLGWTDRVADRLTDLLLVLPAFLILAIMSPLFGAGQWPLFVLMLALFLWMVTSKITRGMTISLKQREFIQAARYMGVPPMKIIFSPCAAQPVVAADRRRHPERQRRHPHRDLPVLLRLGIQPPDVSLGTLIADGSRTAVYAPWTFWFAAGLLVITVLAVNLVGDALRDAFDPTARRSR